MLALPSRGMARSVNSHNVRLDVLCDWIESTVLFVEDSLADSDIVDLLIENDIYDSQNFAWEFMADVWRELRRRAVLLQSGYPIAIAGSRLTRLCRWDSVPGHSFCLGLSLAEWLPDWAKTFGKDYTEQGELFELLVAESISKSLPDWEVYSTGWSKANAAKLPDVIVGLTAWLGEPETGNRARWTKASANEAGLDLVCMRPMADRRPGVPLYLVQCASGVTNTALWEHKRRTPDLRVWAKLIDFAAQPKRGFATPFSFREDDFRLHCHAVDGLLLDRYRLLAPSVASTGWLSKNTAKRMREWLRPRLKSLPQA
jgi:hypothetical protein